MYSAKTLSRSRSLLFVYFLFPYRLQNIQWHSILSFILRFHLSFFFPFFPPLSFRQWYVWGQRNKWRVAVLYYKYAEWWNFYSTISMRKANTARYKRTIDGIQISTIVPRPSFNLFSALLSNLFTFFYVTMKKKRNLARRIEIRSSEWLCFHPRY